MYRHVHRYMYILRYIYVSIHKYIEKARKKRKEGGERKRTVCLIHKNVRYIR